ncbi:MAG TPA: polymer-forming cytoskeletal protein [Candidatus Limnocylindria bacterium]
MLPRSVRIAAFGVLALIVAGVGAVMAGGDVEDKLRTGDRVTVDAGEVVAHDLYVFGGDVVVDGTVEGDLVVASSSVTINGLVQGDVVAGAGQLIVNGEIDGDVRVGAGRITLTGSVGEDLLAGAGQIDVAADGSVGEDLIFGAGDVTMRGVVAGSVYGSATTYSSRNGSVGGSENVTLDTGFEPSEPALSEPVRIAADALRQLLTVVLFGAVALWLVPGALRASESALRRRPLASVGMGIGILVGYIIQFIAVILLMILVGVALGSITLDGLAGIAIWAGIVDLMISTLALVVAASFVVDAVVGLALAQLVARGWAQSRWQELFLLVVGALIVVAFTSLPEIGWILKLCVIVLGLGAMTVAAAEAWQRRHPPAAPSWGAQVAAPIPPTAG